MADWRGCADGLRAAARRRPLDLRLGMASPRSRLSGCRPEGTGRGDERRCRLARTMGAMRIRRSERRRAPRKAGVEQAGACGRAQAVAEPTCEEEDRIDLGAMDKLLTSAGTDGAREHFLLSDGLHAIRLDLMGEWTDSPRPASLFPRRHRFGRATAARPAAPARPVPNGLFQSLPSPEGAEGQAVGAVASRA